VDVELARLLFVEDAQDGDGRVEAHAVVPCIASRRIQVVGWRSGRRNAPRARATSSRVMQPSAWSLMSPIACMNAKTVVGPTKRQPSFLSSFEIAMDSGDVVMDCAAGSVAASGSKRQIQAAIEPCRSA